MIPKKMFFFWSGPSLSYLRYLSVWSFAKLNSDYDVCVYWCPHNAACFRDRKLRQDFADYSGPSYWDRIAKIPRVSVIRYESDASFGATKFNDLNPIFKSDYARWDILAREGGFYSDTDILFIKPMSDYFTNEVLSLIDICVCLYDLYVVIGFLGSSPASRFFSDVQTIAQQNYEKTSFSSMGALSICRLLGGSYGATPASEIEKSLSDRHPDEMILNFHRQLVYPVTYMEQRVLFSAVRDPMIQLFTQSIGIHWFGGLRTSSRLAAITEQASLGNSVLEYYIRQVLK